MHGRDEPVELRAEAVKNWKAWGAVIALAAIVYFMVFHWGRFLADFWPLDGSRVGPNLVASVVQWALIAIAVALLYPPARRAMALSGSARSAMWSPSRPTSRPRTPTSIESSTT